MDPSVAVNKRVDVVAVFRTSGPSAMRCQPYRLHWGGRDIELRELGLRHPTTAGKRMVHVFDVSDGSNDYRLEFDAEALTWTLTTILEQNNLRP